MTTPAETMEERLRRDLELLGPRFTDEEFSTELYRALGGRAWRMERGDGRVSISWRRAEELVNELREGVGREPLALAQTGGEGEVSDLVAGELSRLGWRPEPVDTSQHDPERLTHPETPPPKDQGERQSPADDAVHWERVAHEEADAAEGKPSPADPPGAAP